MWDLSSFVAGMLVGGIIVFIIFWLLYLTRSFVFITCPYQTETCQPSNYIQNPGTAIGRGADINNILFISGETPTMTYKQVPNSKCNPSSTDQAVIMNYPQYCSFVSNDGNTYEGKNLRFNSATYSYIDKNGKLIYVVVDQGGQCKPISSTGNTVISGTPVLKWDIV